LPIFPYLLPSGSWVTAEADGLLFAPSKTAMAVNSNTKRARAWPLGWPAGRIHYTFWVSLTSHGSHMKK
jgi:hypothetical protein